MVYKGAKSKKANIGLFVIANAKLVAISANIIGSRNDNPVYKTIDGYNNRNNKVSLFSNFLL